MVEPAVSVVLVTSELALLDNPFHASGSAAWLCNSMGQTPSKELSNPY